MQSPRLIRHLGAVAMAIALPLMPPQGALTHQSQAQTQTPPPASRSAARDLDDAFQRLLAASSEPTAELIVGEIWDLWRAAAPDAVRDLNQQAGLAMQRGDMHSAVALLDEVVRRAPDWPEGWNQRATTLFLLGDHQRSLADCERVLALEPRHFGALAGMGLIHMAADRPSQALEAFKRALKINPFLKERHQLIPALEQRLGVKPL
jgi:tetratricopeptide (TPR) repeat protein